MKTLRTKIESLKTEIINLDGGRTKETHYNENGYPTLIAYSLLDIRETVEFEYDNNNNCVHELRCTYDRKVDGSVLETLKICNEVFYEYDETGKEIHNRFITNGETRYEKWSEYDTHGNLIHCKYSNGNERWAVHEYDTHGNLIHHKAMSGYEEFWKYNDNGIMVYHKDPYGNERWYDDRGLLIREKEYDGDELFYEYDEKGRVTHVKTSSVCVRSYIYFD